MLKNFTFLYFYIKEFQESLDSPLLDRVAHFACNRRSPIVEIFHEHLICGSIAQCLACWWNGKAVDFTRI